MNNLPDTMPAITAMDIVEAWVGPHPDGKQTGAPDFQTRCAIRKLLRIASESHKQLCELERAAMAAHAKVFRA